LSILNVSKNKLGVLPLTLGYLVNLSSLDVSANKIVKLPSNIGNLTQLRSLIVNRNLLTELPPDIGRLQQLNYLDLWGNAISVLPEETRGLAKNLKTLDMRAMAINFEKQKHIQDLLPDTEIFFSKSCNCQ